MSKIALSGNANGSGTFTIASPNSNSDRILNLPDSAGTLATAESTLTQFNASGSAPVYACRAWVNFDGTGTVAIRSSGNVSSISDNGTGNYTVNFTTAMPDANYSLVFGFQRPSATGYMDYLSGSKAAGSAVVRFLNSSGVAEDAADVSVSVFR